MTQFPFQSLKTLKNNHSTIYMTNYKERLSGITTFVFDYDGVFSDGVVYITESGEQLRTTHSRDGYALQLAIKNNYRICIITGAWSTGIVERFRKIGIHDVFIGATNKLEVFNDFCAKNNLSEEEVLVMGDDIPDYQMLQKAWVACCPSDAVWEIRNIVDYISIYPGGKGCVRDIIEQVMRLRGHWMQDDAFHW
jgi:3-deoxy-D-manno-octulosonate 8-phosphate phosphatase (KDO 8-P phosphatase)